MNLIKVKKPAKYYLEDYMQDFRDEMNEMLKNSFQDFGLMEPERNGKRTLWKPAVELTESEGKYIIKVELPGIPKENIDVEVGENNIGIKAEIEEKHEEKGENLYRSEFKYGKFVRHVPMPSEINSNEVKAEYKDGILTITAPKTEEEQKKIKKIKPE